MFIFFFSRWFRHITEASTAYKSRETRRGGRPAVGPDGSGHNGLDGGGVSGASDLLVVPPEGGKGPGRSHSFHESSTSNREPHPERQPSSPPEDRTDDSFAKKAGK